MNLKKIVLPHRCVINIFSSINLNDAIHEIVDTIVRQYQCANTQYPALLLVTPKTSKPL